MMMLHQDASHLVKDARPMANAHILNASSSIGKETIICGPVGRGTLQIEAREAQNHTNHRTTSQRLYRGLCIVFFFMCVGKRACASVVCGKRRMGKTIVFVLDRQKSKNT